MRAGDRDLKDELAETKAELLKAQLRIEFRELVTSSLEELAESASEIYTEVAILKEKVARLEENESDNKSPLQRILGWILGSKGD